MTNWEFPVTGPITLDARLPAGDIQVNAGATSTAFVSLEPASSGKRAQQLIDEARVTFDDGTLSIDVPERIRLLSSTSLDLVVQLPTGSIARLRAASADIRCTGELGSLEARTASGEITAELVSGPVKIDTASGDVQLGDVTGEVRVTSASGDTDINRAGGDLTLNSASGDLRVIQADGSAKARSASGDVQISHITRGRADLSTVSGDIFVAVPPGIGVYLDLFAMSGDVSSDLAADNAEGDGDAALTLHCRSISGDVHVGQVPAN
ncbi:MAG: DUF4097 family beta strand repeat-containing protein [Actinomycetota bacterium]